MNPAVGNQALPARAALQMYDEPETENGLMMGFGDATDYTYLDNITPTNEYLVEGDIRIPVQGGEMPFMVKSSRGPTGCCHEAFIWLDRGGWLSGWVNVLVSTVLNDLEARKRQRLIDHLERWIQAGRNPGLDQCDAQPPREGNQLR
jgi:hypothetical protein